MRSAMQVGSLGRRILEYGCPMGLATFIANHSSHRFRRALLSSLYDRSEQDVIEAIGPKWNRTPAIDSMPNDLPTNGAVQFEQLAGLFASHQLTEGVIAQPIRQAAYTFGLLRQMNARTVVEVGRWRGGGTVLLAAAVGPDGEVWSIDNQEKEDRLRQQTRHGRSYDDQTRDWLNRHGLTAHLISGDSHTLQVETGEVDVVFIDGDHTYQGTLDDFQRWGSRVRVGGAVLVDDAAEAHTDTAGRVVDEAAATGKWRLVHTVNRLVHLERLS
jgi:predicted O-methyltransferase YrrM